MAIVGTDGHLQATRHNVIRTCEHPCGPAEFEICHFSVMYRPDSLVAGIGTPQIAIDGRHQWEAFQPVAGRPVSLASLSLAPGLSPTTWSGGSQFGFRDVSEEDRALTLASDNAQIDCIQWQDCSAEGYGTLQGLQCGPSNGALLSEGRPVLLSAEDGSVSAFASFNVRGSPTRWSRGATTPASWRLPPRAGGVW